MGEIKSIPSARIIVALTAAGAVAALLTSCAGLGHAGAVAATETPSATASTTASPATTDSAAPTPSATMTLVAPIPAPTTTKTAVVPFVTAADWDAKADRLDVGALVPKTVESGGTCTLTVERKGVQKTAKGAAVAASSYTGCPQLSVEGLTEGTWTVVVSYSSDSSAGASDARTVTVG